MNIRVSRWGNSLAVRIPRHVMEEASLREGDSLDVAVLDDRKIMLSPTRQKYALNDLLAQVTPDNLHDETEWGDPVGREVW